MDAELKRIGDLLEELVSALKQGTPALVAAAEAVPEPEEKPKKKRGRKKKSAKKEEPKPEPLQAPGEEDPLAGFGMNGGDDSDMAGDLGDAPPAVTHDDVLAEFRRFVSKGGNQVAPQSRALLAKYGVQKISQLKEADLPKIMGELEKMND